MTDLKLFLSAVSDEFRTYRTEIRDTLSRSRNISVKIQEDFGAVGVGTLAKLDTYIRDCTAVVHLIGDMTGCVPPALAIRALLERHPDLPERLNCDESALLLQDSAISYTQWEAYLAIYHGKRLFIAEPTADAPRERSYRRDEAQIVLQRLHRDRLRVMDRWTEIPFDSADRISLELLLSEVNERYSKEIIDSDLGGASLWSLGSRRFEEYYLKGETRDGKTVPAPFGGRQRELTHLDDWLADDLVDPRLLVSAPAGRGKSALLAKWIESLKQSGRVGKGGWQLVFVPISNRFQTNAPSTYLGILARQLSAIFGESLSSPTAESEQYYRDRSSGLIDRLIGTSVPTLIIIDGLDEALDNDLLRNILPSLHPSTLKVVISARWQAGDVDGRGWLSRLGWGGSSRAAGHDLVVQPLHATAIAEVLIDMGAPIDFVGRDAALVNRLVVLTEGEPLLLRFYAEDLWMKTTARSPVTRATLDSMQPGFRAYFKEWLGFQGGITSEASAGIDARTTEATMAVLGFAKGPLTSLELLDIARSGFPDLNWRLTAKAHMQPMRRFVVGDGTASFPFVLSHPKLGEYIREDECADLSDAVAAAFYVWGRKQASDLNSKRCPANKASLYALQYFRHHLREALAPAEDYLAMMEDGWRLAAEHTGNDPLGFSDDVRAVWTAIGDRNGGSALLGPEWRCALILSAINNLGKNVPGALAVVAAAHAVVSARQAAHFAELQDSIEEGVVSLARIAIISRDSALISAQIGIAALTKAMSASNDSDRSRLVAIAVEELFSTGVDLPANTRRAWIDAVLAAVGALREHYPRAFVLIAAAKYLAGAERADVICRAFEVAEALGSGDKRASAFILLLPLIDRKSMANIAARALIDCLAINDKSARSLALSALANNLALQESVGALSDTSDLAEISGNLSLVSKIVAVLAPVIVPGRVSDVLESARSSGDELLLSHTIAALGPNLGSEQISYSFEVANSISDVVQRCHAQAVLARLFDSEKKQLAFANLLEAAKEIYQPYSRSLALVTLAPHLTRELRENAIADALKAAEQVEVVSERIDVNIALLSCLDREEREEILGHTLKTVDSISDLSDRVKKLFAMMPYLIRDEQENVLEYGLKAVNAVGDAQARLRALLAFVPHVDSEQKQVVVGDALKAAKAVGDPAALARTFGALASQLSPEQKENTLAEALQAATSIGDLSARVAILVTLLPYLDREQKEQAVSYALETASTIGNASNRIPAIVSLASYLGGEQKKRVVTDALDLIKGMGEASNRTNALSMLAPLLDPTQIAVALAIAKAIGEEFYYRSSALTALAKYLNGAQKNDVTADALNVAKAIGDEHLRSRAVVRLAPQLEAEQIAAALEMVKVIGDPFACSSALLGVAPHLGLDLVVEAIDLANRIGSTYYRSRTLVALVPHIGPGLKEHAAALALEATRAIEDISDRSQMLIELAPLLSLKQISGALTAVKCVDNEMERSRVLVALAPYLAPEQIPDVLQTVGAISNSYLRSRALAALAPYVDPAEITDEVRSTARIGAGLRSSISLTKAATQRQHQRQISGVLKAAKAIGDFSDRTCILEILASHTGFDLEEQVFIKAAKAAKGIGDASDRSRMLASLLPHLTRDQKKQAFGDALLAAKAIFDASDRSRALSAIAKYCPPSDGREFMNELLSAVAGAKRPDALLAAMSSVDLTVKLGGQQAVMELRRSIDDVCRWYP